MSVKERIVSICLAEKVAKNRDYANEIGILVVENKSKEKHKVKESKV